MIAQDRGTQKNFNNRQTVCLLLSALIWDKTDKNKCVKILVYINPLPSLN